VRAAGGNDVVGADHVCAVVAVMAAPRAGFRGVVENRLAATRGGMDRVGVGQVALHLPHADGVQRRVMAAIEAGDFVSVFDQAATQGLAEETTAAGDEDSHGAGLGTRDSGLGKRLAAQRARRSRWILALWRMSTGSAGWKRKASSLAVWVWAAAISRSSWSSFRGFRRSRGWAGRAGSMMTTARCAPRSPTPTRALRRTAGWALNTGSTCSVYSGPCGVSTRCDLRPQNHSLPSSSK